MTVRSFLDSNVLVYTDDGHSPRKQRSAIDLAKSAVAEGWGVVSTQILQEYFYVATSKIGIPTDVARAKVDIFGRMDVATIELPTILGAIDIHRLHDVNFWDALVIYTARAAGCRILYTEDLQHGRLFDGLEVVNPFL